MTFLCQILIAIDPWEILPSSHDFVECSEYVVCCTWCNVNIIEYIVGTWGTIVIIVIGLLIGLCSLVSSLLIMYFCQNAIMDSNSARIMGFPAVFKLGSLSNSLIFF